MDQNQLIANQRAKIDKLQKDISQKIKIIDNIKLGLLYCFFAAIIIFVFYFVYLDIKETPFNY